MRWWSWIRFFFSFMMCSMMWSWCLHVSYDFCIWRSASLIKTGYDNCCCSWSSGLYFMMHLYVNWLIELQAYRTWWMWIESNGWSMSDQEVDRDWINGARDRIKELKTYWHACACNSDPKIRFQLSGSSPNNGSMIITSYCLLISHLHEM